MRIYIAGPYTAKTRQGIRTNIAAADRIARELAVRGHSPFCPHTQSAGWERDERFRHSDFMAIDLDWLEQCEALYFIAHSPGADIELERALELGLPVYRALAEVPDA